MTQPASIDRKAFLNSCLAWAAASLSGCGDDGGPADGGAGMGGDDSSAGTAGTPSAGGMSGGAEGGEPGDGGTPSAGTGGSAEGGMSGADTGEGGSGGITATMFTCQTDTDNGDHSHPLEISSDDVDNPVDDVTYVLEDGGTGHAHTVEVTVYDLVFIRAGTVVTLESSTTEGHSHTCTISCVES